MNVEIRRGHSDVYIHELLQQRPRLRVSHWLLVWHQMHVKYSHRQKLLIIIGLHQRRREQYMLLVT